MATSPITWPTRTGWWGATHPAIRKRLLYVAYDHFKERLVVNSVDGIEGEDDFVGCYFWPLDPREINPPWNRSQPDAH